MAANGPIGTLKFDVKIYISLALAFALVSSLSACGDGGDRRGRVSLKRDKKTLGGDDKAKDDSKLTAAEKKAKTEKEAKDKKAEAAPAMENFTELLKKEELETAVDRALKKGTSIKLNKVKEGTYALARVITEVIPEKKEYTFVSDSILDSAFDVTKTDFTLGTDIGITNSVSWEKSALKGDSANSVTNIPFLIIVNDAGEAEVKFEGSITTTKSEGDSLTSELDVKSASTHDSAELLNNVKSQQESASSSATAKFSIDVPGDASNTNNTYKIDIVEPKSSILLIHINKEVAKTVSDVKKTQTENIVLVYTKK